MTYHINDIQQRTIYRTCSVTALKHISRYESSISYYKEKLSCRARSPEATSCIPGKKPLDRKAPSQISHRDFQNICTLALLNSSPTRLRAGNFPLPSHNICRVIYQIHPQSLHKPPCSTKCGGLHGTYQPAPLPPITSLTMLARDAAAASSSNDLGAKTQRAIDFLMEEHGRTYHDNKEACAYFEFYHLNDVSSPSRYYAASREIKWNVI